VRRKSVPRSFERAGGLNLSEQAVQLGQNARSNGKSELLVRVLAVLLGLAGGGAVVDEPIALALGRDLHR
jgi:hypothetical protein